VTTSYQNALQVQPKKVTYQNQPIGGNYQQVGNYQGQNVFNDEDFNNWKNDIKGNNWIKKREI